MSYRCRKCGYQEKFIYQFTDYTYCVATNPSPEDAEGPEYIEPAPDWVTFGDAEIGDPVGCPNCHAWGVGEIEEVEE